MRKRRHFLSLYTTMSHSTNLGIVTVLYNAERHIERFLDSLIRNQEVIDHVIFVDNASKDNSLKYLSRLDGSISYEVISNEENIGYSAAVNQGLSMLITKNFEHILVTNNDLEIKEGGISLLLEDMESTHADVVGIPTTNDTKHYILGNSFNRGSGEVNYRSVEKEVLEDLITRTTTESSKYVQGGVVLFSKRFLQVIGLYDPFLFFGGDELDFLLRITDSRSHFDIKCAVSLRAYNLFDHHTHHDGRFKLRKATMMIQGIVYVLLKHGLMPWSVQYRCTMHKLLEELGKKSFKRHMVLTILYIRGLVVSSIYLLMHQSENIHQ